jgi:hypothetical protein
MYVHNLKKLPKVNNHPIGKNSHRLVTLTSTQADETFGTLVHLLSNSLVSISVSEFYIDRKKTNIDLHKIVNKII